MGYGGEKFADLADAETIVVCSCTECSWEDEYEPTEQWPVYCPDCGESTTAEGKFT